MSETKWEEYAQVILKGIKNAEQTAKAVQALQIRCERLITEVRILYAVLIPIVIKVLHDVVTSVGRAQ